MKEEDALLLPKHTNSLWFTASASMQVSGGLQDLKKEKNTLNVGRFGKTEIMTQFPGLCRDS